MENNGQNDSSIALRGNVSDILPVLNLDQNPTGFNGASLNKKKDELFFVGNFGNDVSDYLNQAGGKSDLLTATNPDRPPETKEILRQSIVRTLKSDTEKAINLEKISLANITLAEQKKKQEYTQIEELVDNSKSKKWLFLAISLILVFAGVGAFYFNNIKEKIAQTQEKPPEITALIASDHFTEFNLGVSVNKDTMFSLSKTITEIELPSNSIENIHITKNITPSEKGKEVKRVATSKEFLSLLAPKAPGALIRSLKPEYMLGIHSSEGSHPFLILKTKSYENAFAGMLAWEKNLGKDLEQSFFLDGGTDDQGVINEGQSFAGKKEFEDILVKNKDARVLRNFDGRIVLIYSIPDKETILITVDMETLAELFDRVIRSRMVR